MLALYVLGFSLILKSSCRQVPPGPPTGITVYRTATPGQYLVQPAARPAPAEVPQAYPGPIAVVVVPRVAPEPSADGYSVDPYIYYHQPSHNIKPQTLAYAQLIPYPPIKKKLYAKQKISIHQFLKEVAPTTQTAYSEQQAASLRYAQAAPPQGVDQDIQKLTLQRVAPHPFAFPYIIQSETPQDPNQPQPYQHLIHPQQYVQAPQHIHAQQNIQNQQYIQPHPYPGLPLQYIPREGPIAQQPKYQPTQLQAPNTNAGLTYIPINPVMFQKPLVDDDSSSSTPKSTIYVTQKTLKKYQPPQPVQSVTEEDGDDHLEKADVPKKVSRLQLRQYFPIQHQQILVPIIPQQPTAANEDVQSHLQPQLIKYHQIQPLQPEALKYQQIQPEQGPEQQVFLQIRPKKVPPQLVRQQTQQHLIAYHQLPLQQPLQPDPRTYQHLQPTELVNVPRQPIIKYLVQPQILTYQQLQPVNVRQPQIQPETVEYETNQEEAEPQQDLQQHPEKIEEKQEVQLQETPQRQPAKLRKPSLRSRKYRPTRVQVQPEHEEEPHAENQENQQDSQEEFRIQYPDGLKPQATTYAGLRYRRPLQSNSRQLRNKDRAVQIIDDENEDYK